MMVRVVLTISMMLVLIKGQNLPKETYSNANKFPSLRVCGKITDSLEPAIVGGKKAELGAYPWMANIGYRHQGQGPEHTIKWLCGGTLITDRHVLTAAHCLDPKRIRIREDKKTIQLEVVAVQLGDLDIDPTKQDGATPQKFDIDKIIYHEEYSHHSKENDIGLVKLKRKVDFTDLIRPICLPLESFSWQDFVGEFLVVAGWGFTFYKNPDPNATHLLHVAVEVSSLEVCRKNITSLRNENHVKINSKVMCAGSPGKDSCKGDSGGPLMYMYQSSKPPKEVIVNWFQIAIVSYGFRCAEPGYPGVYTRVSSFMNWIEQNVDYEF